MKAYARAIAAFTTVLLTAGTTGCGFDLLGSARTTDGGGGNLLTGGFKLINGQLTQLTQDEVQVLSDQIRTVLGTTNPGFRLSEMTNAQADSFIEFLHVNSVPGSATPGLNSLQDLQSFAAAAQHDPSIVVVPQSMKDAYADQIDSFDADTFDVNELLQAVFGDLNGPTGGGGSTGGGSTGGGSTGPATGTASK